MKTANDTPTRIGAVTTSRRSAYLPMAHCPPAALRRCRSRGIRERFFASLRMTGSEVNDGIRGRHPLVILSRAKNLSPTQTNALILPNAVLPQEPHVVEVRVPLDVRLDALHV